MATVHIQPGTGIGSGTLADPYYYDQLSTAETQAGAGGTILFTDGDYTITGTTLLDGVGSSGNSITYQSLNSKGAVIKSNTSGTLRQIIVGSTGNTSNINVENFKFIDCNLQVSTAGDGSIKGNDITTSTAISLAGGQTFISAVGSTGSSKFQNNLVIFIRNSGNYIERDTGNFAEFSGNTIYVECGTQTFYFCYAQANSFAFCTVSKNNILYADDGSVIDTENNSMATNMTNSCFYQWDDTYNTSGGTNNIFADPLFVDVANRDFRLRPGSPCINDSEPSLQDLYPNALWVSGEYTGGSSDGSYSAPYTTIKNALASNSDADVVVCVKAGVTSLTNGYSNYPSKSTVQIIGEKGTTLNTDLSAAFGDMMSASNATYTFKNINFLQNNTNKIERGVIGNVGINFNLVLDGCTYKVLDNCGQWSAFRATNITVKNCFIETYCYGSISGFDSNAAVLIHDGLFTAENCTFYNKKNNYHAPPNDQTSMLYNRSWSVSKTASYTNCIFYAEGSTNTTTGLTGNNFNYRTFTDCCVYSPHNYLNDFTASQDSGTPVLADPLFVDRANGDFRLRPGSPCITI